MRAHEKRSPDLGDKNGDRSRTDSRILRLKVTLKHVRPAIWRRLEVPADLTLGELHQVIQGAMGWSDRHLHQFFHRGTYYGTPNREFDMLPTISERRTRVAELLQRAKDRLVYEYDFGDSWAHDVVLERVSQPEPGVRYSRVTAGKRACPPEDVGGFPGYANFLDVIADPNHKEHADTLMWVGGRFDPEAFDVAVANDRVPKKRMRRR